DHWISKTLANDSPRQGLVTMKDANGCLHRLSWISSLLYTPDGEVEGILVLGEDVTEREGAAKALQKQVAYLNTIIDNLSELFCTFDREFKVTFINKMSTEVIGYDANALTGKSLPNLLQITNREWDKIKPQLEIGASVSWEQTIHHRNGDIKVLRVNSAVLWEDDEILGGMLLGDDITDERRALTALTENESTLRQITDNMTDLISRLDPQGKVLYASPSHYSVLGYQLDELKQLTLKDLVHPDDLNNSIKALKMALRQGKTSRNQQRSRHANGSYIWTETVTNPLIENGKITGAIMSSRDITERKKLEDDLRFLSVHDPLTGLYNRTYFETEMERLDGGRYDPVGIVVCDLDGLKLVNDTLGHEAGDRLLISTAAVLKQCFRQSDVVSRVGGDEFAILLPGSQHDQLEMLVNRIYEGVAYYNFDNPDLPLSLSVGMAVRGSRTVSMRDAYKEADNEMYRVKLNRSKSARSAVVQTLMKALEARDYITEGHAERLQELAARMGRRLGLSDNTITSLQLLAQFHDIGKVGVPDRILFKPGLLTEEEYAEMKRHCEIGHRIALASQELSSLAELILKHHEWWDGKGYPSGLKGHDIPLECRILALADAYDAMTSNRPYRQGMEHSDALLEIEHHAGTQFDPVLAEIFVDMLWDDGARYDS
ncbi:MAG: HD domain-containing phosphohydrolase, partial [Methylocystaceae bacterium]